MKCPMGPLKQILYNETIDLFPPLYSSSTVQTCLVLPAIAGGHEIPNGPFEADSIQ